MSSPFSQGVPSFIAAGPSLSGQIDREGPALAQFQPRLHGLSSLSLRVQSWLLDIDLDTLVAGTDLAASTSSASSVASSLIEGPPGSSVARSSATGKSSLVAVSMNLELDLLGLSSSPLGARVEPHQPSSKDGLHVAIRDLVELLTTMDAVTGKLRTALIEFATLLEGNVAQGD